MEMTFTPQDGSVLYGLLADSTSDIILKIGCDGSILHASPGVTQLGVSFSSALNSLNIANLVHTRYEERVRSEYEDVISGCRGGGWFEVLAVSSDGSERWFDMKFRTLRDSADSVLGALGIMRNTDERRLLEHKLFAAEMTDPLTGLTNRKAFVTMLQHLVDEGTGGCLALFDIDYFQSINMQHGQSVGDRVLIVFADLLRSMMGENDIISRIDGECLGVLLPAADQSEARELCHRIVTTLSGLRSEIGIGNFAITASAGLSRIDQSVDDTMRRAELALFLAKAKGRNRLEMENTSRAA